MYCSQPGVEHGRVAGRTERQLLEQYDRLGAARPRVVWSSMDLPDPVLTQAAFALFPLREITSISTTMLHKSELF